jgi:peptidoglycan LD-endopeptidase LytH
MTDSSGPAKIELCSIGFDAAREMGVCPGLVPREAASGQSFLLASSRRDPWVAPLNIAGRSEVFDFTKGYDPNRNLTAPFGIGRFGEDRMGMYESSLFKAKTEPRTIHMGLDIGASEGTPVFAPLAGEVWGSDHLASDGDYGGTVILKTEGDISLFMLLGHLSKASVRRSPAGTRVAKGELMGWLGGKHENGGWNPHLHWQISWLEPLKVDLPGAISKSNEALSRLVFADPTELLRVSIAGWS